MSASLDGSCETGIIRSGWRYSPSTRRSGSPWACSRARGHGAKAADAGPPATAAPPRRPRTTGRPLEFNFARDVVERLARNPNKRAITVVDENGIVTATLRRRGARGGALGGLLRRHRLDPGRGRRRRPPLRRGRPLSWERSRRVSSSLRFRRPSTRRAVLPAVALTRASLLVAEPRTAPTVDAVQASLEQPLSVLYLDEAAPLLRDQPLIAATHPTVPRDPPCCSRRPERRVSRVWLGTRFPRVGPAPGRGALARSRRGRPRVVHRSPGTPAALWFGLLAPCARRRSRFQPGAVRRGRAPQPDRAAACHGLAQSPEEYRLLTELEGIEGCDLRALRHAVSWASVDLTRPRGGWPPSGWSSAGTRRRRQGSCSVSAPGEVGSPATGTALPGHGLVVLAGGEELEPGNEGELALVGRPPTLFAGVPRRREAREPQGQRYLTGDRAVRDASGSFWLTGRNEDAISTAGSTVGALEIEAAARPSCCGRRRRGAARGKGIRRGLGAR